MKYTEIGYFGPSTNVQDAPIGDAAVASILAALDALPRRRAPAPASANVIPFPTPLLGARGPKGEPLRFIAIEERR